MSLDKIVDFDMENKKPSPCKGLVFRGVVNRYFTYNNSLEMHESMGVRLLKRKSCKGCPHCDSIKDEIHDNFSEDDPNYSVIHIGEIKNGALYRLKWVEDSRDWETGYCDDWHYEFEEVKSEENN